MTTKIVDYIWLEATEVDVNAMSHQGGAYHFTPFARQGGELAD